MAYGAPSRLWCRLPQTFVPAGEYALRILDCWLLQSQGRKAYHRLPQAIVVLISSYQVRSGLMPAEANQRISQRIVRVSMWAIAGGLIIVSGLLAGPTAWAQTVICSGSSSVPIPTNPVDPRQGWPGYL